MAATHSPDPDWRESQRRLCSAHATSISIPWSISLTENPRQHQRRCVTLAIVVCLFGHIPTIEAQDNNRPNIIMMMADDMGWGNSTYTVRLGETADGTDVNYAGTDLWEMPNLEEMAGNGLKFSRMYSQSPVCSPTRASVLTGRAPERTGVDFAGIGKMENREVTIAEYASSVGYRTGIFGKWHLGTQTRDFRDSNNGGPGSFDIYSTPRNNGFDTQYVTEAKVATYNPSNTSPVTRYWTGPGQFVNPNSPELQGDSSLIVARETNSFMAEAASNNQPFMAVSWFHSPHLPTTDPNGNVNNIRSYRYAMEGIDDAVGQIRDQVNALGLENDTIIMFTSDNGSEDGHNYPADDGLRNNKRELHEGGIRVPGVIEWNETIAAGETHTPAVTTDYLPTLLDIWGIDPVDDRPLDGTSITETLFGDRTQTRQKSIITRSTNGHRAVIGEEGRYKLISTNNGANWELYDLVLDYGEANFLVNTANVGSASPELQSIYNQLLTEYGDWTDSVNVSRSNGITGDFSTLVASVDDAVLSVEPPENLEADSVTNNLAQVYLERQFATLTDGLIVNSDGTPGTHDVSSATVLPADLTVHSFLVHFNPEGQNGDGDFSITFDNDILGVIGSTGLLPSSDYLSFADPDFDRSGDRGLESSDSWTISSDGRTISFSLDAIATLDQVRILQSVTSLLNGDFDGDGVYDCSDVDALVAEIAAGNNDSIFDLDGNNIVDGADLDLWLAEAGAENNASGNAYLYGDANLDGSVDASDFNVWNSNKFSSTAAWCHGDFNADGSVDASDFNVWNANKFTSSDLTAVPEPSTMALCGFALLGLLGFRRKR